MVSDMKIISKEVIKPSSPTPIHLRNLKLSFLDQIAPPMYVPLIFFFNHHQLTLQHFTHTKISRLLKQSLSKTLTIFYPLGGRIQENSSVDCNDSGVEFIEARVHTHLSELIQEASMEELKKLQPVESSLHDEEILLKVKICFFDCGGISVAVSLSHKIADGISSAAFVKAWSDSCRGESETNILRPIFDLVSVFPQRDLSAFEKIEKLGMCEEKLVTKRFVFEKEEAMKMKNDFNTPRVVEAVSAYLWRRFMDVARAENSSKTSFAAIHAVNLRPRRSPEAIPEQMFGNCFRRTIAFSEAEEEDDDYELVVKLRWAIARIDDDYIRKLEEGEHMDVLRGSVDLLKNGEVELCSFSSWRRFPVYEVDFGWGKPVWVCTTTLPYKNLVVLMSTPCGEGIEAWANMVEEDMKVFEQCLNECR
ncbi:hypothetical protein C2S51_003045 [Perilla frutescens var. frutescens]|nr:hypothetical protein C2S51_003045 [Perilla frutescens var. frutescens]